MMSGIFAAWREIKVIVLGLSGVGLLTWLVKQRWLSLLSFSFLGGIFYFFRDPERVPASLSSDWILAPADGTITDIELVQEPLFFNGPARRVSMFLSLLDVHVQRIPFGGTVQFLHYQPGGFAPAFLKNTRGNAYNYMGLVTPRGRVGVKQITGILARRIVCRPQMGDTLATGQRFGLIKFGSRVDLLLPPDVEILAHIGQKVNGGQSIVARWSN